MLNAHTELYCIFGKPVKHTLSPLIHNTAFHELGINAVYLAFDPDKIDQGVQAMRTLNIKGASITIPFKIDVTQYIDDIDQLAQDIGSVNTLKNDNGVIKGYNTDGLGAIDALRNNKVAVEGKTFLVIGNGGSARAVAFTLLDNKSKVIVAGRNKERIESLSFDLKKKGDVDSILLAQLDKTFMKSVDVIINTTPVGMHPEVAITPIHDDLIDESHTVFDIVYSPDVTILLKTAKDKGCIIVRGFEMLLYQGVKQFEIWTGQKAPVASMYKVLEEAISKN